MQQRVDPWKDMWAYTPRYERWIDSLGVPVHRTYFVRDLRQPGLVQEVNCHSRALLGGQMVRGARPMW